MPTDEKYKIDKMKRNMRVIVLVVRGRRSQSAKIVMLASSKKQGTFLKNGSFCVI